MTKDLLFDKFKYNVKSTDALRKQALRNAYILYGFDGLIKKLQSIPTNDDSSVDSNLKSDITFIENEKKKIG
jgi:hypothetical protein